MLFGAFVVLSFEGTVKIAVFAMKFLLSVFGVTIFAQVGALAAAAGQGDHGLSLSVAMWTLPAIQILDLGIVVPSASISLITGIIFSSMTHWGFMKHRWIVVKYTINLVPVVLGALVQAPWLVSMIELAKNMRSGSSLPPEFLSLRNQFLIFTILQWVLLIIAVYLSIFKPSLKFKSAITTQC